jgi:hypothetical protein
MQTLRYWGNVIVLAVSRSGAAVGFKHPNRWLPLALVWGLSTFGAYGTARNYQQTMDFIALTFCGLGAAIGITLLMVLAHLVTIPAEWAATDKKRIAELEATVQAPRPNLGLMKVRVDQIGERLEKAYKGGPIEQAQVDAAFLEARDALAAILEPERVGDFVAECSPPRVTMSTEATAYYERAGEYICKIVGTLEVSDLLPD